jgi:hypothetical protein
MNHLKIIVMKRVLFIILVAMCVTNVWADVQADLVIKKWSNIDIDGKPDDAIWSLIDPVPITGKFNDENPTVTASFKMFYTDEFIYLLLDVEDDVHHPAWIAESSETWMFDKVEVYFDVNDVLKDGNGPAYTNGYMAPGHYQMAPTFEEGSYEIPYLPTGVLYGSLSSEVFVAYALKADNKSYTIEYEFPMAAFKNDRDENLDLNAFKGLPAGMGFDVVVIDNDNDGAGRKRAVWKNEGPDESYINMDGCGVIVFDDKGVGINGITKSTKNEILLYPNPVSSELTIDGDFEKVIITNTVGQQVKKVADSNRSINVSDLTNGVYIIRVYQNGVCTVVGKIIKE